MSFAHPASVRRFGFGRFVFGIGLFLLALMGPGLSHASCVWRNFSGQLVGPAPLNFNFGLPATVNVSSSAVNGDVLASVTVTGNATAGLNCNPGPLNANTPYRSVNGANNSLMATGVAGVEFRMIVLSNGQPYAWNGSYYIAASVGQQVYTNSGQYRLELVKTGPITGGTVSLGQLSATSLDGTTLTNWYLGNSVNIVAPVTSTCTVTTPSISVDLGTVSATEFTGVGSVSTTTKSFYIGVQCSVLPDLTMTDASQPSNSTTALSLAAGSTATGVGLQITNPYLSNSPVTYKAKFPVDYWTAGNRIPFNVRYVQTATTVKAGSANGLVEFTFTYN